MKKRGSRTAHDRSRERGPRRRCTPSEDARELGTPERVSSDDFQGVSTRLDRARTRDLRRVRWISPKNIRSSKNLTRFVSDRKAAGRASSRPSRTRESGRGDDVARRRTEVLLLEVERGQAGLLAAVAVVEVVVIEAKHGGGVGNERVRVRVAALRGGRLAAEEGRHAAHERRLAAARVRGEADDDRAVTRGAGDDVALRSANFRGRRELRGGAEGLASREGLRARGGHGHGGHLAWVTFER